MIRYVIGNTATDLWVSNKFGMTTLVSSVGDAQIFKYIDNANYVKESYGSVIEDFIVYKITIKLEDV